MHKERLETRYIKNSTKYYEKDGRKSARINEKM